MKPKLFNLITVFLATSGLLTSASAAFGQSLHPQPVKQGEVEHLACVKQAQQLICQQETSKAQESDLAPKQGVNAAPQPINPQTQKLTAKVLIWLSYLLPTSLILGIFLFDAYGSYRSAALKRQIDLLEKLWQSSSDNDATTDSGHGANS
jgi:hypothetical protein